MFHTAKPLELRKRCIWLHEADDDPLAKIDNAVAVKKVKPQRTPEPVRVVLEQDQRTNRFDLLIRQDTRVVNQHLQTVSLCVLQSGGWVKWESSADRHLVWQGHEMGKLPRQCDQNSLDDLH